ncbi:MAG: 6-bladed beta-propeller, partial [Prevotellaceae bacterium]|nr:6-bladed beta-propeller [Prevotellaceae bacterium]
MKKISYLLILVIFWGCNYSTKTEKYQNKRDNIFHVQEKVKEIINTEDVLTGSLARLHIVHDYLIISDYHSTEKLIYIFD